MSQAWFKKASVQTAGVSGMFAVIVAVLLQFGPVTRLTAENEQLRFEVQRLERRLAPFPTVAIGRYPGDQEAALARLAKDLGDLQSRLDSVENEIRGFEVVARIRVSADWSRSKPSPGTQAIALGSVSYVELTSDSDHDLPAIVLYPRESRTIESPPLVN